MGSDLLLLMMEHDFIAASANIENLIRSRRHADRADTNR